MGINSLGDIMTKKLFNFDNSYEKLPKIFYRKVHENPVSEPKLLYYNDDLGLSLGLDNESIKEEGQDILSGSFFPSEASSISQAYMGDQYGHLTMLGDGRAVLIGEILDKTGKRFDIQLKGSGKTPFSRGGDGKATLGAMLKEYIFSEGLFGLNVPTTRSLALLLTGEGVIRNKIEDGAVLTRVASSHIRVGTFQYAYYKNDFESLKILADYSMERHFPEIARNDYLKFFEMVIKKQASLIAKWMSLGFVHGVMNTDNMAISGETIDFGPCAFIDEYDLKSVYSSIDRYGRYAFSNQPTIAFWNLARLGESLWPLISQDKKDGIEKINGLLDNFGLYFYKDYYQEMTKKLGIFEANDDDGILVNEFLSLLSKYRLDYTNSFLDLTNKNFSKDEYKEEDFVAFFTKLETRYKKEGKAEEEVEKLMLASNPQIIPRNFWVQESIKLSETGDFSLFDELLEALKNPFEPSEDKEKFKIVPKGKKYVTYCGT